MRNPTTKNHDNRTTRSFFGRGATWGFLLLMVGSLLPLPAAEAFHGHCGFGMTAHFFGPTIGRDTKDLTFYAKFFDGADHCGIDGWHFGINGSNCHDCGKSWVDGDYYNIEWTRPPLAEGTYTIDAVVRESCGSGCTCFVDATCNHGIVTWTLVVYRDCGSKPLTARDMKPGGSIQTQTVTLEVTFDDTDIPCGLEKASMVIDGKAVTPAITTTQTAQGEAYHLSYAVPSPLAPGWHVVSASVEEHCCITGGKLPNTGNAYWTFHVNVCGTAPLVASEMNPTPGSVTSDPQPIVKVRFHDPDTPCDLSGWTFAVDGIERSATYTRAGADHILSWPVDLPLTPGPHTVVATVTEWNSGNKGTASWTFYAYTAPGGPVVFERYLPGADGNATTPVSVGIDRECHTMFQLCLGPFSVPVPTTVSFEAAIEPSRLSADVDPTATARYGPFDLTIHTPFGPFPLYLCGEPGGEGQCELPAPTTGGSVYEGRVRLVLEGDGETHTFDHPFTI